MIPRLQERDAVIENHVDDSMFFVQAARPHAGLLMPERFWLPNAFEWFANGGFDNV